MTQKTNLLANLAPAFISLRTHFNFFRRAMQWLINGSRLFAKLFKSFTKLIPFWGRLLDFIEHAFNALAFGNNPNMSKEANLIAYIGYGLVISLMAIGGILQSSLLLAIVPAASIVLGLYFEANTIFQWLDNLKEQKALAESDQLLTEQHYYNALNMVNASVVTFAAIALKGVGLSLAFVMPSTSVALIILAQITEVAAMIGSAGKEQVNIAQNIELFCPNYFSSHSKISEALGPEQALDAKLLIEPTTEAALKSSLKAPVVPSIFITPPTESHNTQQLGDSPSALSI